MNEKVQRLFDDIKSSEKKVTVLPSDESILNSINEKYNLNPESVLGILLYHTGGIVIDDWIRLYGSGKISIISRNEKLSIDSLVVAEDILGGLFICLNNGNIGYFSPDCLQIEDMEMPFNHFLYWCLHGNTDVFYSDYRWDGWQNDVSTLNLDDGVMFYPFLWTQADSLEHRKRSVVPMDEIIRLEMEFLQQISD